MQAETWSKITDTPVYVVCRRSFVQHLHTLTACCCPTTRQARGTFIVLKYFFNQMCQLGGGGIWSGERARLHITIKIN